MVLALGALVVHTHATLLSALFSAATDTGHAVLLIPLLAAALWMAAMAELARMPIDDPTTHLELTMIHEAMLLEYSGRTLAFIEFATALKLTVLLGLVGQVVQILEPPTNAIVAYLGSLGLLGLGGALIVVGESTMVKLGRGPDISNLVVCPRTREPP
jgi:formate hydrogenlyase subunit 4